MQAVQAIEFGGPEVLVPCEVADPVAAEGEAVIEVAAADVLMLDVLVRRGAPGPWQVRPPYVPGRGVGGQVVSVGPGVDESWLGRRVVAKPGRIVPNTGSGSVAEAARESPPTGGYARSALASVGSLLEVPDPLGTREAVALINDGMTAMLVSRAAPVRAGERVVVAPAGGGLGSLLVQLAHAAGATVIAAARGARKLDLARRLGADRAVDYSADGWADEIVRAAGGSGPDVVLDGVGGRIGDALFAITARGGRFFAFGAPSGAFTRVDPRVAAEREVAVTALMDLATAPGDEQRLARRALAEAAAGRLRPTIGRTFPLDRAAAAHTAVERREVVGKTLLLP